MTAERRKVPVILAAMIEMIMNDPEALLFGYALAVSNGDEESLKTAKVFRKQAEELGVTEQQFNSAVDAMKKTDEFLAKAS